MNFVKHAKSLTPWTYAVNALTSSIELAQYSLQCGNKRLISVPVSELDMQNQIQIIVLVLLRYVMLHCTMQLFRMCVCNFLYPAFHFLFKCVIHRPHLGDSAVGVINYLPRPQWELFFYLQINIHILFYLIYALLGLQCQLVMI